MCFVYIYIYFLFFLYSACHLDWITWATPKECNPLKCSRLKSSFSFLGMGGKKWQHVTIRRTCVLACSPWYVNACLGQRRSNNNQGNETAHKLSTQHFTSNMPHWLAYLWKQIQANVNNRVLQINCSHYMCTVKHTTHQRNHMFCKKNTCCKTHPC